MLALINYTRFPIYYNGSGTRILGEKEVHRQFRWFVNNHIKEYFPRDKCLILHTLEDLKFKRRFVVGNRVINPSLQDRKEERINKITVFPNHDNFEETINNSYSLGITLRGHRNILFLPLASLRKMTEQEVNSLLNLSRTEKVTITGMMTFAMSLGIRVERKDLADGVVLTMDDPEVESTYQVLLNPDGRIIDTNMCFELERNLYLPEFILLTRERRYLVVYHDQSW